MFLSETKRVLGNNSWDTAYVFPNDGVNSFGIISIGIANVGTAPGNTTVVDVAITNGTAATTGDHIEYRTTLDVGSSGLERAGINIKPGDKVFVRSNGQPVDVRVNGILYNSTQDDILSIGQVTTPNSWKNMYTVPASTTLGNIGGGTFNISAINASGSGATISIAISTSEPPTDGDYLVKDMPLAAYGDGVIYGYRVLVPGEKILVYSDTTTVAVRVDGLLTIT